MNPELTVSDIINNAFDKDYSVVQVTTDLGELMMKLELIKRRYETESRFDGGDCHIKSELYDYDTLL